MKIYIAAPWLCKPHALDVARACQARGIIVTSRWLFEDSDESDAWARHDLADVAAADWLVALNPPEYRNAGTGGRHVELGYALALGKPVLLVGDRSNIFHHLSDIARIAHAEPETITTLLSGLMAGDPRRI